MIEQPDSEKPRDEWSDPRTTPASVEAATQAPENADPEVCNNALAALDAELDAAVDAEPESGRSTDGRPVQFYGQDSAVDAEPVFAHDANSITIDPNGTVWVNKGKAPAPTTKFKALNGGQIVYALPVKGFRADQKTAEHFIILSDDSERPRPLLHGYIPKVGDMFVQYTPITVLDTNQAYVEQGETIIMGKRLFEALYYPVQE